MCLYIFDPPRTFVALLKSLKTPALKKYLKNKTLEEIHAIFQVKFHFCLN